MLVWIEAMEMELAPEAGGEDGAATGAVGVVGVVGAVGVVGVVGVDGGDGAGPQLDVTEPKLSRVITSSSVLIL